MSVSPASPITATTAEMLLPCVGFAATPPALRLFIDENLAVQAAGEDPSAEFFDA